ncbi:chemotaxis protein CheW [Celerinatantimonas sp. MCCC 1A17872]|uniref:chemotaxis protein CheW n=1 Tax=Celerinatantimonas sp. MCCC 1A17872 TaxID=3177514 RepID=UPI0038BF0D39
MSDENQVNDQQDRLQILSFVLGQESFGTEISCIQEVLEYRKVTAVPRTPDYMLGVINLRGQVVPVVDLRQVFAMPVSKPTIDSCIIIVKIPIEGEETALGILADKVKEVVEFNANELKAPPRIGNKVDSQFISGMLQHEDEFIILLRLTRVFSSDQLHEVLDPVGEIPVEKVADDAQSS